MAFTSIYTLIGPMGSNPKIPLLRLSVGTGIRLRLRNEGSIVSVRVQVPPQALASSLEVKRLFDKQKTAGSIPASPTD